MLSALPIMVGLQMLLSAINFDVQNVPRQAIHLALRISPVTAFERATQEGMLRGIQQSSRH
jgi:hypothetical protein